MCFFLDVDIFFPAAKQPSRPGVFVSEPHQKRKCKSSTFCSTRDFSEGRPHPTRKGWGGVVPAQPQVGSQPAAFLTLVPHQATQKIPALTAAMEIF